MLTEQDRKHLSIIESYVNKELRDPELEVQDKEQLYILRLLCMIAKK